MSTFGLTAFAFVNCWRQPPITSLAKLIVKCSPSLGQPELEFSGVKAHVGICADEPFMSEIGTLLPMALCGRNSL